MLFASGQLAVAADGSVPEGIDAQCDLIFANLDAILAAGRMTRSDVIRVNAFVIDRADLKPYMAARGQVVRRPRTARPRTLMLVSGFTRPEFKVEIEIVAAREKAD